jgi:hypothetical protein
VGVSEARVVRAAQADTTEAAWGTLTWYARATLGSSADMTVGRCVIKPGHFMTIHNSACWRITEDGKSAEWREPPTFTSLGDSGNDTGHLAELAAIREGRTTRSNIFESSKSMVFYEAIRTSPETGRVVPVRYEGP